MKGNDVEARIRVGISTCLLGERVRYDGGHKLDHYLTDTLGKHVEYVPVCSEVEAGLGVPSEAMHLEGRPERPRLVTVRSKVDLTERMLKWAKRRVLELEKEELCGFIFKSGSPSSGMERVRVYDEEGRLAGKGVGMFAEAFIEHFPLLPVEDEGRLHDADIRENFIERMFVYRRWREVERERSRGKLVEFQTRHKLLILSHSPRHATALGRMVAEAKSRPIGRLLADYQERLMEALRLKATRAKHLNVLQHAMGYFKKELSGDEKQELLEVFGQYREGFVPLVVPMTLIDHYVRKYGQGYLKGQHYLNPHPVELQLRSHV